MPLTLADGKDKFAVLTAEPADPSVPTATELAAGVNAGPLVNKPDFRFSPTSSDTVSDQPLSKAGNAVTYGNSNFEATVTVLRFLDAMGKPDAADDILWDAVKVKGARLWCYLRRGPEEAEAWAAGDEFVWAEVVTDDPQDPSDRAGYIKNIVPLGPQSWGRGVVAAGV